MPILWDELSVRALGGTEYMLRLIESSVNSNLLNSVYVSRNIDEISKSLTDKPRIFYSHQVPLPQINEEWKHFTNNKWNSFDYTVFVSHWQKQKFFDFYNLDSNDLLRTKVIYNAIEPFPHRHENNHDIIKIIYISSPERGLDILHDVFVEIAKKHKNVKLIVYSSTAYYHTSPDKHLHERPFLSLYSKLKSHPQIEYHERVDKKTIRNALMSANIFAYPCKYPETSCMSLMEAISAGCICVHPNIPALVETSGGLTQMYETNYSGKYHAKIFYNQLEIAINKIKNGYEKLPLILAKQRVDYLYNQNKIISQWDAFLHSIITNKIHHQQLSSKSLKIEYK